MTSVEFTKTEKRFGDAVILSDFSRLIKPDADKRMRIAVMGPSGSGKTTFLRLIGGLDKPDAGAVAVSGIVSAVFQEPRLFPWMTARENIICAARGKIVGNDTEIRAARLIGELGLSGAEDKYPAELSGGMQKRVSIARALLYGGDILLLDEPTGALDAALSESVMRLIEREAPRITVFVTHDAVEAETYATEIFELDGDGGVKIREINPK